MSTPESAVDDEVEFLPPQSVVDLLRAIQDEHGWLEPEALKRCSAETCTPLYKLHAVATFFPHFRHEPPPKRTVTVCRDAACWLKDRGALVKKAMSMGDGDADLEVEEVSCLGRCEIAPAFTVDDVPCGGSDDFDAMVANPPEHCAHLPAAADSYKSDPYDSPGARWGALRKMLDGGAEAEEAAIAELKTSGLRGMGGAGFPTGLKWGFVRGAEGSPKFVVCNADESEPGTFKDREILGKLAHLVIEGMICGAKAVGANRCVLYIRHEYEPEEQAFRAALDEAKAAGAVGENVLGFGWHCDFDIFVSPGGYICGEETALLEALEGKRGEPRNKPPFPGTHGLHGKPTLINNVETFAFTPWIVLNGGEAWKGLGVNGGAGMKFLSVSGDVADPKCVEVPMGTTVQEVIDLCGGMADGKELKAFFPGGASSHFLPASAVDTPMDFDALGNAGSMLGSGALFVVAEGTPMLPLARNLVEFFRNESCGKCVPCRVGSEKAVRILDDKVEGREGPAGMDLMPELADAMAMTSICGLGQAALNPILSILKHFPDETA
ncbi:MAG: NADH-ubiquinone oxidoreductase-F iron-sulfur binding region domain-containing protein, partial [Planctomycetota bacterium]|jgi:NADH:ubiquinone oxidoreductase subunit F (NADH-binding)/NADH:ubiquinone oxidoreductase subunit E